MNLPLIEPQANLVVRLHDRTNLCNRSIPFTKYDRLTRFDPAGRAIHLNHPSFPKLGSAVVVSDVGVDQDILTA